MQCTVEGTLFSPGSKTYCYSPSVKRQLRIEKKGKCITLWPSGRYREVWDGLWVADFTSHFDDKKTT